MSDFVGYSWGGYIEMNGNFMVINEDMNGDSNRDIHGKHGRNSETVGSDLGDRPLIGSCW